MAGIRLNAKGLVKFMVATPAQQRKILQDYKFPKDREAAAMSRYYREAQRLIREFHAAGHARGWLLERATHLEAQARFAGDARRATRLRHNSRALIEYERSFGGRKYAVLPQQKLALEVEDVRIRVVPDLVVMERGKSKLVVFEFRNAEMSEREAKIYAQCLFEAARLGGIDVGGAGAVICAVSSGTEHRGARVGSRMLAEIEAACKNISALWDGITPPRRRAA